MRRLLSGLCLCGCAAVQNTNAARHAELFNCAVCLLSITTTGNRICISTNLRKSKVTRTSKCRALQCQFQRLSLVTRVRHLPCLVRKHTLMYYACMGGGDSVLDYLMVGSNLGIYMYSVIHPLCCNYLLLLSPKIARVCLGGR